MIAGERGLTLVELLVALAVTSFVAVAAAGLLFTCLQAHAYGSDRAELQREALFLMERMTSGVRTCTFLLVPSAQGPKRGVLAFSGTLNDDDDYYFDDRLFPRIDEDPEEGMADDGKAGVKGLDDDGDGRIDEGSDNDDDEDGLENEDPLDGLDNDGDGNLDEDAGDDSDGDGASGAAYVDDDGDGAVDEAKAQDDDEDGKKDEDGLNPLVYSWDGKTGALTEVFPEEKLETVLSTQVTMFEATYVCPGRIHVALTLTNDKGDSFSLSEYVCPRNTLQRTGKRVR